MKNILVLIVIISSFSFGQYRKSAMEAWYNSNHVTGVDSFTTTGATDSVTIPTGYTTSSQARVFKWNPAWSIVVDTAEYSGQVVITGAGLTKLVVSRVKSYTGNGATAVKSAAHYFYEVKK
jgi:hypothetical protein